MRFKFIRVKRLIVGNLSTNCYLVFDNKTKKGIIIDPGDDAQYISSSIEKLNVTPTLIIITHGHFDHVLATNELKLIYNIPVLANSRDLFLLNNLGERAIYFGEKEIDKNHKISIDVKIDKLKTISVSKIKLKIINTPGHTPGSVSLLSEEHGMIFVGDLIFDDGSVGRTDFNYSNKIKFNKSLNKIFRLRNGLFVFPGHGKAFKLGHLKRKKVMDKTIFQRYDKV
jgi:glyoxylase-like metal-dependent hydrolase (beta-lactamase superfamily II)